MIRAGSLAYAVFVSTITAVLCLLMIMVAAMNRNFFIHTDNFDRVRDNAHSGIMLGLALNSDNHEHWYELYEAGSDSVHLKKRRWGLYEVISSRARIGQASFQKTAVSGFWSHELSKTALWLRDRNRPLQLAGDALLKGEFYLPKKGVDRAYVEGTNYTRQELLYGTSENSDAKLPQLQKNWLSPWQDYLNGKFSEGDSLLDFGQLPQKLTLSFHRKTAVFQNKDEIRLGAYALKGNLILLSKSGIRVAAGCTLEQVVLIAPKIIVEEGFEGSLHAVAVDSLIIQKDVKLSYPSSLCMILEELDRGPHLFMADNSEVRGAVVSISSESRRANDLAVEISPKALVKGMLYCNGNLELNGTIEGGVWANTFMLSTPSGIYENHLLNGKIDRTELEEGYLGLPLQPWNNKAEVAIWLPY